MYTYFIAYDVFTGPIIGKANAILTRKTKIDSYEELVNVERYLQELDNLSKLPIISNFKELSHD